jgi:hypothetical protein
MSPPVPLEHPGAWTADALSASEEWNHVLDRKERDELSRAVTEWRSAGIVDRVAGEPFRGYGSAPDFPLPLLGRRLDTIRRQLEEGTGAVRVKGLPLDGLTADEARLVFWAIGVSLGTPVSQSPEGDRIFSVRDAGFPSEDPRSRGPNTTRELSFHTDRSDVVGFLCLRQAAEGGANEVASAMRVYNVIRGRRPELLDVLQEPFYYLRHTVDHGNDRPWCRQPVFSFTGGKFACCFLRVLIERAHRSGNLPPMTEAQVEALDLLESVAEKTENRLRFRQDSGDLFLINNWTVLHRRSGFVDHPDPAARRHILRIWLAMPNSRPIDRVFAENWGAVEAGAVRGGMPERRS